MSTASSPQQILPPGTMLDERYLIEKELGRGGIGVVYLARDKQLLSRPVVVKVLIEDGYQDDWVTNKFRQEIEALSRLDHPGIVGIFDAGELENGKPYLVMQYVEGVNLRCEIKPEGMDLERSAHIIKQVGRALSAAHDQGILHRDLKPENIMLRALSDDEEQVKVIDFGIAKVKNSLAGPSTQAAALVGTIAYMSPEQLEIKPVAATSDIYTFGVIAYEMLTGRRPFNPVSAFQLLEMQRAGVKVMPGALRPNLPEEAQAIILRALSFEPKHRYSRVRDFCDDLARALTAQMETITPVSSLTTEEITARKTLETIERFVTPARSIITSATGTVRVAILYKRNARPDEEVLKLLETELLAQGFKVFIDRHLSIGVEWAREIERQVRTADAVIPLLSEAAVSSEMLAYEVQIAHEAAQQQQGKPRILPVRVNYEDALPDPLAGILDPLQYALWKGPEDSERLVSELVSSLQSPLVQKPVRIPQKLEAVGGAMPLDSEFYIVRPTDEEFRTAIARQDSIVLVKGARQMGKTSLLARGLQQARETGAKVVLTDFQKLNAAHLESVETLFMTLAELLADQLDLEVFPDQVWTARRGPSMNFERYVRREVLGKISSPLVWGLDEVDRLFTCPFGSEVFGLFRSWHNERSLDPTGPWQRLTLAIVYATEAHLFITDINQSPFNVGTRLTLEDFTFEQVAELNARYGSPLKGTAEVARFFRLLSGQPYLVRRGLHELATHDTELASFEATADRDEGPFGDHLRRILVLLAQDQELCDVVREVLRGRPCPTPESFYRLRSAGVMAGDSARDARPRCQLYSNYLERHLL
ncbi:MAG TPA: AAA-like domain-containing protein [Pyrinomonadaceae bacterium]